MKEKGVGLQLALVSELVIGLIPCWLVEAKVSVERNQKE